MFVQKIKPPKLSKMPNFLPPGMLELEKTWKKKTSRSTFFYKTQTIEKTCAVL